MSVLYVLCARLVKLHLWSQEKVVNFENLTYLTRWPQPAAILLVKICKNPVFGVAKLQEPNLVPTQHTEIDIETSSQNRANNAPKSSQQRTEIDLEPRLGQKWRNSFVELSKKPLHTIRI